MEQAQEQKGLEKFNQVKADIAGFVAPLKAIKVESQETSADAIAAAKTVKAYSKKVEELRKALVAPYNEQVKRINSYAATLVKPLDEAEELLKIQLKNWDKVLEAQRAEAARRAKLEEDRIRAEAKKEADALKEANEMFGVAEAKDAAPIEAAALDNKIEMHNFFAKKEEQSLRVSGAKKVWSFEAVDFEKIPREYLLLDEKAVRAAVREGVREIPGIRIYQDTQIAIR